MPILLEEDLKRPLPQMYKVRQQFKEDRLNDDEETAIRVALKCCRNIDRENPKIIRIKNTLHLEYIEVSPALLDDVKKNPSLEVVC